MMKAQAKYTVAVDYNHLLYSVTWTQSVMFKLFFLFTSLVDTAALRNYLSIGNQNVQANGEFHYLH